MVRFGSTVRLELWRNDGMYKKNTEVEVLAVVDLFQQSFFFWYMGDTTQVERRVHLQKRAYV